MPGRLHAFAPVLLAVLVAAAPAGARSKPAQAPGSAGSWIVLYNRSAGSVDAETTARERALGFRAQQRFRHAVRGFAARLTPAQVAALRADPDVASVGPDRPVQAVGQLAPTGVRRIGAVGEAGARGTSDAGVAVVDTGIDLDHPDLNVEPGTNCIGDGSADDDHGHGTHVAGTVAARDDGAGVVGVAPGTALHAVKVLDAHGSGSDSTVVCGLDWVAAHAAQRGIKVVNMSLGGLGSYSTCGSGRDAMHEAVCRLTATGVTVVVAAGNEGWDLGASPPDTPAWYPEVLTVTAMSDSDGLAGGAGGAPTCAPGEADDMAAGFSNFASLEADAAHTIAAPGTCILSTLPGARYGTMSGTSMASPHVAGEVALCLGESGKAGPCASLTPAAIVSAMRSDAAGAAALGGFGGDPDHEIPGRWYGHLGRVPARAADGDGPPPPADPPAPAPADASTPVSAPSPPAEGDPEPAPRCRIHIHLRRHLHRRSHRHRRPGHRALRHVHRRVHVHRIRHRHCG